MKSEKISIKWKIFTYLLSFIGILLFLLWIFQTVYLDRFYKIIKKKELDNAAENIISVINDEDLETAVETIAGRYDICILITDLEANTIYSAETITGCMVHRMRQDNIRRMIGQAVEENGELEINIKGMEKNYFIEDFSYDDKKMTDEDSGNTPPELKEKHGAERFDKLPNMPNENDLEGMIKVKIVSDDTGNTYVVLLNSIITPVGATVHTLRIQLICISVTMVILSLGLAFIMSKRVSKSIINVNSSAKELARGKFDIEFNGRDYREIAELSETLNHTAKELAKTDVLQKELLANVSHDLRTPLTMITAYSEVMRDLPGENTPENVQVVIDETKRLTCLVNDLLDISKIQAGVTTLETKEYDITESIKAIVKRHSKLLEPYGYQIIFRYETHILVEADEFKIYQVIYNLLANAVNYAGEDKIVEISQKVKDDRVRIEVKDNGAGIPKDRIESVWERYYKVDRDHKRAIMGSGLGLSIVKNILILHEAEYGVESEEGKGSVFWFELTNITVYS